MAARLSALLTSPWVAVLAVALGLAWGFWAPPLSDIDEGAFTEATREMLASGNYVSIYLNGEPRHDKPILIYWLQAASAQLFGLNEFALRLPSVVAAVLWCLALYRFTRRQLDSATAVVAASVMALALYVGLIAKGAIADALLNLFLALAFFDIYNHFVQPARATVLRVFLWLGLGFLTKGPVVVLFPLLASGLLYLSERRWRDWLRAVFDPLGIAVFLAVVLPWHVAVYLDSGWAFFEGFYLQHNVGRYGDAMEGHSGGPWYYLVWAPLVVLPFSGWLLRLLPTVRRALADPLQRFLWIWFALVLLVFSFSSTKLPHYLLYGCSPLFILMAQHRERLRSRWLAYLPAGALLAALLVLPQLFARLAQDSDRVYEQTLFAMGAVAFDGHYQLLIAVLSALFLLIVWRVRPLWQGLILVGLVQAVAVSGLVLPRVAEVLQGPVKEAALFAKQAGAEVVAFRDYHPSFSVYRQAIVQRREPRPGEWVLVRIDNLERFHRKHPQLQTEPVFERGTIRLLAVTGPDGRGG